MDDESHKALVDLAMAFYVGEPCRICGKLITKDDLNELVYAGYSEGNKSRAAHGICWQDNKPKEQWQYPIDAID